MLHYAIVFFIIALIGALFGFGALTANVAVIGKSCFFICIVLAIVTFVASLIDERKMRFFLRGDSLLQPAVGAGVLAFLFITGLLAYLEPKGEWIATSFFVLGVVIVLGYALIRWRINKSWSGE